MPIPIPTPINTALKIHISQHTYKIHTYIQISTSIFKMKKGFVAALFAVVVMAVLVHETTMAAPPPPVVCNPTELASCAGTVFFGLRPTAECCSKLRVQQPCFCTYIRDPQFKQFLVSSNSAKFTSVCNVTIPTTC